MSGTQHSHLFLDPAAQAAFPIRRKLIGAGLLALGGFSVRPTIAFAAPEAGVAHNAEAIHQELTFTAPKRRVYEVLTEAKAFDRLTQQSAAMSAMSLQHKHAEINARPGGTFSLFGGYISGRFIDLVPEKLIVQAWRVGNWDAGLYSIAHFMLVDDAAGSRIVFDHTGFPAGAGEHLADGWYANYWDPLAKVLA